MKSHRIVRALLLCIIATCWSSGTVSPRTRHRVRRGAAAAEVQPKTIRLRGDIDWAGSSCQMSDVMPGFHVYFAGSYTISDANGMYALSVPEEDKEMLTNLSLIICKRFTPSFERGQTLAGMKIEKAHKCKWYDLSREYNERTKQYYWDVSERTGDNAPKNGDLLPSNAIIVSISGSRVVRVEDTPALKAIDGHVKLPRVVIAPGSKSERAAVKSDIESITSRQMNANQTMRVKESGTVTVAAPVM